MRIGHIIAAGLAGILLIQSAAVAQTVPGRDIRTISHEQGLEVLLANLQVGADLRIDLADGRYLEGRLVEKSAQALVVEDGRLRRIVPTADVVDVHVPKPAGLTGGNAFGIGAAIGAGVVLGWFFTRF
jgi:hypothetical protein